MDIQDRRSALRFIAILMLISPIEHFGFDISAPALPMIRDDFGTTNQIVQHSMTLYSLGLALVLLPLGLAADALGRKKLLVAAMCAVLVTSLGCAFANSMPLLLTLRFLQGIGAGTCFLLVGVVAADHFRGSQLVSVYGLLTASWASALVVAPLIGGYTAQLLSWRWIFVLFAVFVAAVLVLTLRFLPETLPANRRSPIDLRATATVIRDAFSNPRFVGFTVMFSLIGGSQMMFSTAGPFLYQDILGFAPSEYGLVTVLIGLTDMVGSLACSWLAARMSLTWLANGALIIFAVGAAMLVTTARTQSFTASSIAIGSMIAMLGIGLLDPLSKGQAMGVFTENIGLISALVFTVCFLFDTVSVAVLAVLPEEDPEPLGWSYAVTAILFAALFYLVRRRSRHSDPV